MNWSFWSLSRPAHPGDCESIEPLLSLYADGVASADEARRVESHLPGCEGCRESLSWMQATHRALAGRPAVLPPADLHSRIAQAIAASSAAPVSLRPIHSFKLRPAYAAAASLTVLGLVLSYSLHLAPDQTVVKPTPKPTPIAAEPAYRGSAPAARLPHPARLRRPLVASNRPPAAEIMPARHLPVPKEIAPVIVPKTPERVRDNSEHVAAQVPAVVLHPVPLSPRAPVHILSMHQLTAREITPHETRLPSAPKETAGPKLSEPMKTANRTETPAVVPVNILPATETPQPPRQTASAAPPPPPKYGDILGAVKTGVVKMSTVSYQVPRQSYRSATNVMHTIDNEHFAYQDAIHLP